MDAYLVPKKDTRKRPGRPPGRKNNSTLKAEEKRKEAEKVNKSVNAPRSYVGEMLNLIAHMEDDRQKLERMYHLVDEDIAIDFSGLEREIDAVYGKLNELMDKVTYEGSEYPNGGRDVRTGEIYRSKDIKSKTEKSKVKKWFDFAKMPMYLRREFVQAIEDFCYFIEDSIGSQTDEKMRDVIRYLRDIQIQLDSLNGNIDMWKSKSISFKNYKGTWQPIAKAGHYTMWKCNEEPNAFNVVTKTMKNTSTGKFVEKIVIEDVDGFEDKRLNKTGLEKKKIPVMTEVEIPDYVTVSGHTLKLEVNDGYYQYREDNFPVWIEVEMIDLRGNCQVCGKAPGIRHMHPISNLYVNSLTDAILEMATVLDHEHAGLDVEESVSKKENEGIPMDNLSRALDSTLREFAKKYGIDTNEDNWEKKVFEKMVEEDGYDPSTIDQHLGYYDLSQRS